MKIYVIASNKYTHVCHINVHFLNKYWPNQDITLLGYEEVEKLTDFPNNVTVKILGKQDDFGKSWSDGLIPFFNKVEENYFIILVEDMILLKEIDYERINLLEQQFLSGNADKAMIGGGLPLDLTTEMENGLLLYNQGINYRCSLHPAIWSREYFLRYLKPGMTIWDFELRNDSEARNDGAKIITNNYSYPQEPDPFLILNLYNKERLTLNEEGHLFPGAPPASRKFFNKEDLTYIWEKIHEA